MSPYGPHTRAARSSVFRAHPDKKVCGLRRILNYSPQNFAAKTVFGGRRNYFYRNINPPERAAVGGGPYGRNWGSAFTEKNLQTGGTGRPGAPKGIPFGHPAPTGRFAYKTNVSGYYIAFRYAVGVAVPGDPSLNLLPGLYSTRNVT